MICENYSCYKPVLLHELNSGQGPMVNNTFAPDGVREGSEGPADTTDLEKFSWISMYIYIYAYIYVYIYIYLRLSIHL